MVRSKPDINDWTNDCKKIGIAARRLRFANTQLPEDEVHKAHTEYGNACSEFANKYCMSYVDVSDLAVVISDNCKLGLAY